MENEHNPLPLIIKPLPLIFKPLPLIIPSRTIFLFRFLMEVFCKTDGRTHPRTELRECNKKHNRWDPIFKPLMGFLSFWIGNRKRMAENGRIYGVNITVQTWYSLRCRCFTVYGVKVLRRTVWTRYSLRCECFTVYGIKVVLHGVNVLQCMLWMLYSLWREYGTVYSANVLRHTVLMWCSLWWERGTAYGVKVVKFTVWTF